MKLGNADYKNIDTVTLISKKEKLMKSASAFSGFGVMCAVCGFSFLDLLGLEDFRVHAIIVAVITMLVAGYQYFQIWQIQKELAGRTITETEAETAKTERKKVNKRYVLVLVVLAVIVFAMTNCDFGGNNGSVDTNECKSCHRTYKAGDSGGNYKSIARSGMCKNCKRNYEILTDALGK